MLTRIAVILALQCLLHFTRLDHALILEAWPAPLAALARRKDGDPKTALRFEAYAGGLELANAFDELVDPVEQRARFVDEQRIRASRGKPVYPLDEKLLAALAEGPWPAYRARTAPPW